MASSTATTAAKQGHASGAVCWCEYGDRPPLRGGHFKLQFGPKGPRCFTLALQPLHGTCCSFFTHELRHMTEPAAGFRRRRMGTAMITNRGTLAGCAKVFERGQGASAQLKQAKQQQQQQSNWEPRTSSSSK